MSVAAGMVEFEGFPKIARLKREITITEKLDGTNAAIQIVSALDTIELLNDKFRTCSVFDADGQAFDFFVQSRNRFITPKDDNYGFARWVQTNSAELIKLGPGTHFGEWWGQGIQRNYGLTRKCFSLFNTARWDRINEPDCCDVVPVLYQGEDHTMVDFCINQLAQQGSLAVPGFMKPEGIVIYHSAMRTMSKVTIENDDKPKGAV